MSSMDEAPRSDFGKSNAAEEEEEAAAMPYRVRSACLVANRKWEAFEKKAVQVTGSQKPSPRDKKNATVVRRSKAQKSGNQERSHRKNELAMPWRGGSDGGSAQHSPEPNRSQSRVQHGKKSTDLIHRGNRPGGVNWKVVDCTTRKYDVDRKYVGCATTQNLDTRIASHPERRKRAALPTAGTRRQSAATSATTDTVLDRMDYAYDDAGGS